MSDTKLPPHGPRKALLTPTHPRRPRRDKREPWSHWRGAVPGALVAPTAPTPPEAPDATGGRRTGAKAGPPTPPQAKYPCGSCNAVACRLSRSEPKG